MRIVKKKVYISSLAKRAENNIRVCYTQLSCCVLRAHASPVFGSVKISTRNMCVCNMCNVKFVYVEEHIWNWYYSVYIV